MRLYITGSRGIKGIDLGVYVGEDTELIISSGRKGIEAEAEKYADDHNIEKLIISRNRGEDFLICGRKMVDGADRVVVMWNGKTKNEKRIADYAARKGKTVDVVLIRDVDTEKAVRLSKNTDFIFDTLPFQRKM